MRKSIFLIIIQLLCLHIICFSQRVKNEVEESIVKDMMPERAMKLLSDLLKDARKVHFYRETDGEQVSFEAKMARKGGIFSIEFYEDGSLMDIEKLISYHSIPQEIRDSIEEYLAKEYKRFKVRRTQKQFSAEEDDEEDNEVIEEFIEQDNDDLTIRYEIEIDVRDQSGVGSYEMLFDEEGHFLNKRKIIRRSLDNILY